MNERMVRFSVIVVLLIFGLAMLAPTALAKSERSGMAPGHGNMPPGKGGTQPGKGGIPPGLAVNLGLNVDGNNIYWEDPETQIGIGTDDPQYPLDVNGYIHTSTGIKIGNTMDLTDGAMDIDDCPGNAMKIGDAGDYTLYILGTDLDTRLKSVGIGIASPVAWATLDVNGKTLFRDSVGINLATVPSASLEVGGDIKFSGTIYGIGSGLTDVNAELLDGLDSSDFALAGHNHDTIYYTKTEMDTKLALKSDTGHIHDDRYYTETETDNRYVKLEDLDHLNAADGAPTNAVYVDNNGKVGIGTTQPGEQLHVNGAIKADKLVYSSPRKHYMVVGGEAFVPWSNVAYQNAGGMGGADMSTNTGQMVATVDLPHGAKVTKFKVFFYNNTSTKHLISWLGGLKLDGGSYIWMADVDSVGISNYGSKTDTTISYATIDNTKYSYHIKAYGKPWDGAKLRIMGAYVEYELSEAP